MTAFVPVQVPAWQLSVFVQALLSLQAVPSTLFGFEHRPVEVSQVPAVWHWSSAVQTTGLLPVQLPFEQVSVRVHALPSLHVEPFALTGLLQVPVLVLQVPTSWH